jgi:hypothetical protein
LKSEVEQVPNEARHILSDISIKKDEADKIVISMRTLTSEQKIELKTDKDQQSDKAKSGMQGKWWKTGLTIRISFVVGDTTTQAR